MKIKAQVNLLKDQTKNLKAFASIILDDCFLVENFRVMSGAKGLWVAMPSEKMSKPDKNDKKYRDTAKPITADFRKRLFEVILAEYEKKANAENSAAENEEENGVKPQKSENEADEVPF